MFGAFKPSAPLSGGLLWKIPWRLSPPQKLRHRRRMRRVDNIVSVLDTALKRTAAIDPFAADTTHQEQSPPSELPNASLPHQTPGTSGKATASELASTAQGQRLLETATHPSQESRRHGRGPKQGDMVPSLHSASPAAGSPVLRLAGKELLGESARALSSTKLIERWKVEMPTEAEMLAKDKYTLFDKKAKGYRKGVHKLPKWTRVSQRLNPPGF